MFIFSLAVVSGFAAALTHRFLIKNQKSKKWWLM